MDWAGCAVDCGAVPVDAKQRRPDTCWGARALGAGSLRESVPSNSQPSKTILDQKKPSDLPEALSARPAMSALTGRIYSQASGELKLIFRSFASPRRGELQFAALLEMAESQPTERHPRPIGDGAE